MGLRPHLSKKQMTEGRDQRTEDRLHYGKDLRQARSGLLHDPQGPFFPSSNPTLASAGLGGHLFNCHLAAVDRAQSYLKHLGAITSIKSRTAASFFDLLRVEPTCQLRIHGRFDTF
jgi:hypothetical protein